MESATAQSRSSAAPSPPLSPRNASYTIDARLDPASRTITATETITWRNITRTTTSDLQFHLYWNAWRNTHSTWMREQALAGVAADPWRRPDEWSRIEVTSIRLTAPVAVNLTAAQHFI